MLLNRRIEKLEEAVGLNIPEDRVIIFSTMVDPRIDGVKPPVPALRILIPGDPRIPARTEKIGTA